MNTLSNATHAAHLDVFTGIGAMVCPVESHDLHLDGMNTLNSSGWDDMVRRLARMGWSPLIDDETEDLSVMGRTLLGQTVVTLYGTDPIIKRPSLEQTLQSYAGLRAVLGIA